VRSRITANGSLLPGERAEKNRTVTVMPGVQVGVAVVAHRGGPVAVRGGQVVVEVPVPAAPGAVVDDRGGQPVPLQPAVGGFGAGDQAGQPGLSVGGVGCLVVGQPGTPGRVAVLDVDRPSEGGPVGDLLPAAGAGPGQRRVAAAAGERFDRVLGGPE
jgi:hypothetical protein